MEFFDWLFGTRWGVLALFVGGIIIAFLVAMLTERTTSKRFYNHERKPGEEPGIFEGLFDGDDEDQS